MKKIKSSQELKIITLFTTVTILFVVIVNMVSLYYTDKLHVIAESLYKHPLKVSNAALNVQKGVFKMHRDMKDIVLSRSPKELHELIKSVDREEKEVYKYLKIIKFNILGIKGAKLCDNTYKLFKQWRGIRKEVIELIQKNRYEEASKITKEQGAAHVVKLENAASALHDYARKKADNFKKNAHETFQHFQALNIILTVLTLLILVVFTLYVKRRMQNYIQSISTNEEKIEELNERFKLAIEGANDGLWDWNLQEETIYFSPKLKEMLGYRDDEFPNEFDAWESRVHPDDLDEVNRKIELSHSDPAVAYNITYRMRHKNGSWVWILDRGQTIFDENQKPIRMIGFHTDITRQKELEMELREKDHLLLESQRLSSMGSWKLDFTKNKLTWSDEIYNIFELDKNRFQPSYENFLNVIHPDDRQKVDDAYTNSLQTKEPYNIIHRLLMEDGRIKYVHESCETTFDTDSKPLISIGTVQDITKQKVLEEKLIALKQQFEQFMEFMPANIIIKEDSVIVYANSSAAAFFNKERLEGESLESLFPKNVAKKLVLFEEKAYQDGFNEEVIEIFNHQEEKKVYRNMSFVIDAKEKKRLGIVSIDITQEYHANKEIAKVLSAFERSNMSVVITDVHGNIQYVNPSWCKITGYTKEELFGQNPRIVKSGYISPQTYKKMWEELTSGRVWHSELKNRAKDGTEFWEDSTIIPSFDSDGKVDGYIAFKLEISETIRLREELKEQEEIMIAQSRHAAMGEMISMIAHQWRQPISVIAMDANNILVDIELDSIEKESLKSDINDMLQQTKYLSQTIDDFRDFFKPSKVKDEVLVSDVFQEALSVIMKSLENHNIKIENNFQTHTTISIYSRELLQVFINILKNAKEALEENRETDRKITNTVIEQENGVVISVCDNAGGINDDIISKIFDPYFTTKDEKNGTGLGLYMSKSIIEKHLKGSINAYNRNGGVCFEIILPFEKTLKELETDG